MQYLLFASTPAGVAGALPAGKPVPWSAAAPTTASRRFAEVGRLQIYARRCSLKTGNLLLELADSKVHRLDQFRKPLSLVRVRRVQPAPKLRTAGTRPIYGDPRINQRLIFGVADRSEGGAGDSLGAP